MLADGVSVGSDLLDDAVARILRVKLQVAPASQGSNRALPSHGTNGGEASACRASLGPQERRNAKERRGLCSPSIRGQALAGIALLGPLADASRHQLGCWMLDGKPEESVTIAAALSDALLTSPHARRKPLRPSTSPIDEDTRRDRRRSECGGAIGRCGHLRGRELAAERRGALPR